LSLTFFAARRYNIAPFERREPTMSPADQQPQPRTAPRGRVDGLRRSGPGRVVRFGLLLVGLLVALGGCRSVPAVLDGEGVQDSARRLYYAAMVELANGNHVQATQLFQQVASSPRYVRYAALARLRIGDALFFQSRYHEATEVYRSFTGQHKGDPNMPYARYMVAVCHYKRLPGEWFLSPPAHEMDQSVTRQAEAELKGFLSTFPTSRFAPEARRMLAETREMLFSHEVFAADFYARRGAWRAVAWRLQRAIDNYPELGLSEELVWRMADAYARTDDQASAVRAYGLYLKSFPDGERRDEVRSRLDALRERLDDERRT